MSTGDESADELARRLDSGDREALNEVFARHRDRLRRMVDLRMDVRLQGRIDASDVIQDALLEASERLDDYLRDRPMPLFLWLRFLATQRLAIAYRHHLGTEKRDAAREISLNYRAFPEASSAMLAAHLVGSMTSPLEEAIRGERCIKLQEVLNQMQPIDREVIALRHFEQLSRAETAEVLGIEKAAASKRYVRAMDRLRAAMNPRPNDTTCPDFR